MQQAKAKAEIDKPFASQLNRELSTADKVEETIVRTLAFLFVVFFSEGLFLAVAVSPLFASACWKIYNPDKITQ